QRVFDRFYQGDLRERKTQAGSGLGLSIARWIAEAYRADLTVESTPLKGSVFQIKLPLPTIPYAAESKEQAIG
ncbi:MAG: putative sensor histidine kinase, partial [Edaphobacter sp.]|nr:putative sensor histidine kinase [Edaphobacter sp.]